MKDYFVNLLFQNRALKKKSHARWTWKTKKGLFIEKITFLFIIYRKKTIFNKNNVSLHKKIFTFL